MIRGLRPKTNIPPNPQSMTNIAVETLLELRVNYGLLLQSQHQSILSLVFWNSLLSKFVISLYIIDRAKPDGQPVYNVYQFPDARVEDAPQPTPSPLPPLQLSPYHHLWATPVCAVQNVTNVCPAPSHYYFIITTYVVLNKFTQLFSITAQNKEKSSATISRKSVISTNLNTLQRVSVVPSPS